MWHLPCVVPLDALRRRTRPSRFVRRHGRHTHPHEKAVDKNVAPLRRRKKFPPRPIHHTRGTEHTGRAYPAARAEHVGQRARYMPCRLGWRIYGGKKGARGACAWTAYGHGRAVSLADNCTHKSVEIIRPIWAISRSTTGFHSKRIGTQTSVLDNINWPVSTIGSVSDYDSIGNQEVAGSSPVLVIRFMLTINLRRVERSLPQPFLRHMAG